MRESLKHVFSSQVVSEDGSVFYYSISPYDLKNAWAMILLFYRNTVLQKRVMKSGYLPAYYTETKDGNWYDIEDANTTVEKGILRLPKSPIDAKESKAVAGK